MNILWAPNPLHTVIELDEHEKRWFRERLRSLYLEERINAAHFALASEHREWLTSIGKTTTLEESVTEAVRTLDQGFTTCEEERNGRTFEHVLDEQLECYLEALAGEHDGDCICFPCSCSKCYAEGILGIDTLKDLGKHEASKIGWAFKGEDPSQSTILVKSTHLRKVEHVSIEEAVEKLKAYQPVYTPSPNWPEEEWQKHVPRWTQEGRRAYEWLSIYHQEHFRI